MVDKNLFQIGLFIIVALSIVSVIYFKKTNSENIKTREKITRNVFLGTILICIDLIWCIPISKPIAPEFILPYLFPIAFFLTYLGFQFLDYHFARAIGGFIILSASFFLSNVWAFDIPEDSILAMSFSLLTYIFGIIGLFLAGKPYLLRDWFRKCSTSAKIKTASTTFFVIYATVSIILAITLN